MNRNRTPPPADSGTRQSVAAWAKEHGLGAGRYPDLSFVDLGDAGVAIDGPDPMRLTLLVTPYGMAVISVDRASSAAGTGRAAAALNFTADGLVSQDTGTMGPTYLALSMHLSDLTFVGALLRHRRNVLSARLAWKPRDLRNPLALRVPPPDANDRAELDSVRKLLSVVRHPDRDVRAVALRMLEAGFTGPTDHLLHAAQTATG